jgi:hypothetical protein
MADPIHTLSAAPRRLAPVLGAMLAMVAVASCVELNVADPGRTVEVRVTPDTVNLRIGDSTVLRAAPVDDANTLLAQEPVLWASSAAGVATVDPSGLVRGVGSGVVVITATSGTVEGSAVAIISGAPTTVVSAAGDAQTAGVNEFVAVPPAVRVTDAQGNGVYAVPVTFAVTSGGGSITAPQPVLTDVNGRASVPWRLGPTPGANTLSATTGDPLAGDPVTFTATAEVGPPDAATSSVEALPATIPPSAGSSVSTVTVTVRDALGRTVAGAAVTLAVSGTGNALTQPGTVTDNQGQTSGTLSSTVAETKTVTATVNGVLAIAQTAAVVVNPGAPAAIAVITEPAGAVSNAYFLTQPVVEIRDGFGNRLPTATDPVTVALEFGDGVLASGSGTLTVNAVDGRATFSGLHVRGPRVAGDTLGLGAHVLRFTVPGLAPVESDTVRVEVSWAYNVVDVLNRGCVGCHAYTVENTLDVPVAGGPCIGRVRVVAGDSTSLLYEKMQPAPSCGSAMPFGPLMSPRQRLIVRDWIVQGARNN